MKLESQPEIGTVPSLSERNETLPEIKTKTISKRLPEWLRKRLVSNRLADRTDQVLNDLGLNTICRSGRCPNRNECYSQSTATFMIMGTNCTRRCLYCSVNTARPSLLDPQEPENLAQAVKLLGLEHVVVTSVTRDDLEDEGIAHFEACVRAIKSTKRDVVMEVLTPDFRRRQDRAVVSLSKLPIDVFNHNIETVQRIHKNVRPQGGYRLSMDLIQKMAKSNSRFMIKSGAMLGMGELRIEVIDLMQELRDIGCVMLTLGQYLQSSKEGVPVRRFVSPSEFEDYKKIGYTMGFLLVESGPFVRSSYHAKDSFDKLKLHLKLK